MKIIFFLSIILCLLNVNKVSAKEFVVKHYQKQERYLYGAQLLELALKKTGKPYKIVVPEDQEVNEGRGELMVINGEYDLQFHSTTREREQKMIPVKIPVYRGVLGLRLLLVKKNNLSKISGISDLSTLRSYTGGHGKFWGDLPVYKENNLDVVTNVKYEGLFKQLIEGRFHYFHRGLNEIWDEQERYAKDLVIADNIMLFYKHPVYFFVTKKRPELATLLEQGLKVALEDGSYKQHFLNYMGKFIKKADLASRKLVVLKNPVVPENTNKLDTSWWLPKQHQQTLLRAGL